MRTITTKLYTIDELENVNKDGYEQAIETLTEIEQDCFEFEFDDYRNTIKAIEKLFFVKASFWKTDWYSFTYQVEDCLSDEIDSFKRTYSYVQNTILPQIEELDDCFLTGCCTDWEAVQVLENFIKGKEIFDSVTELIEAMCKAVLKDASQEFQSIETDFERLHDRARFNEYEFTADGEIYRG